MTSKSNINKSKIIILSIIIIIIISSGVFYEKKIDFNNKVDSDVITLVKNKTWDTNLDSSIPYNKGDDLEYSIILKPNDSKITKVDINKIGENIDIKEIKLDGEIINIKQLDNINIEEESILEISGEAIKNNSDDNDLLIEIEKEEIVEKETLEEVLDEKVLEEKKEVLNITLNNTEFSSNINNLLEITGDNLEEIKFVTIGSNSFTPKLRDGKIFIGIDSEIFGAGNYFVLFQLNSGDIITHDEQVTFIFNDSKVSIANITPNVFKNDINRNIVLQGKGFSKVISIQLSNNIILKNTNFNIINDNVMSLLIPKELSIGKYKLNIMDVEGIYKSDIEIEIIN